MPDKSAPKRPTDEVVIVKRTGRPDTLETLSEKLAARKPKPAKGQP